MDFNRIGYQNNNYLSNYSISSWNNHTNNTQNNYNMNNNRNEYTNNSNISNTNLNSKIQNNKYPTNDKNIIYTNDNYTRNNSNSNFNINSHLDKKLNNQDSYYFKNNHQDINSHNHKIVIQQNISYSNQKKQNLPPGLSQISSENSLNQNIGKHQYHNKESIDSNQQSQQSNDDNQNLVFSNVNQNVHSKYQKNFENVCQVKSACEFWTRGVQVQSTQNLRSCDEEQNDNDEHINQMNQKEMEKIGNEKIGNEKIGRVLFMKNFESSYQVKPKNIYNLFSNFGNIEFILIKKQNQMVFIQFETSRYAQIAKDYLNNMKFYGNIMRLQYSKYDSIKLEKAKKSGGQVVYQIFSSKYRRFDCPKQISINYPSQTIHISNLESEITEDQLLYYVKPYGHCTKIKLIQGMNDKQTCFIKMSSVDETLDLVSNFHNTYILKNQIKVSFTNTRIQ